jgi:hypothetical protein
MTFRNLAFNDSSRGLIRDLRTCLRMSAKIKLLTSSVPPLDDRVLADVRL